MKHAVAVIGAGYGDEGKGLMTDYFCSLHEDKSKVLVVRFNGGAQAGHTVVTPRGERHVFSHYGAGTFQSVDTYLSNDFIVNPILFNKEMISVFNGSTRIFMGNECRISTPYDMLVNQCIESSRNNRHGSCGIGIHSTMQRSKKINFAVKSITTMTKAMCRELLNEIKIYAIGEVANTSAFHDQNFNELFDLDFTEAFYGSLMQMMDTHARVFVVPEEHAFRLHDHIVFEGAQGLLLNEKYGIAPHLTPSDTGCESPMKLCDLNNVSQLDICYVSRAYTTRHGAGPLLNETTTTELCLKNIEDETNVQNEYQGNFRYAHLNTDVVADVIDKDFSQSKKFNFASTKSLAITCLDQIPNHSAARQLKQLVSPHNYFESYGPTRADVKSYK